MSEDVETKRNWFQKWRDHAEQFVAFGAHSVSNGIYRYLPDGKIKPVKKPVKGAIAEFETGAQESGTTLTRVIAGGIIAGPLGAVAGGLLKKNKTKVYASVLFEDGDMAIIEAPQKDQMRLRQFVARVNKIASA